MAKNRENREICPLKVYHTSAVAPSTGKIMKNDLKNLENLIKFATKWYTKLCNQLDTIGTLKSHFKVGIYIIEKATF